MATQEKDSYVREAQSKESRLFILLDGISTLWKDAALLQLLQVEGLGLRPRIKPAHTTSHHDLEPEGRIL